MHTSRSRARTGVLAVLLATVAVVTAPPARAGIVAYATRSDPFETFLQANVILTNSGETALTFKATGADQLFQITFNAECHVVVPLPTLRGYVGIVMMVNGQPLQPYETGDPSNVTLCSNVWDDYSGSTT